MVAGVKQRGHRRLAFWVQAQTIRVTAPHAVSGERACGRCNGPATLVWEHVVRRAPPIARSLRAAGLHASARRTEIRHGTARLTIAVMWPRCLHDVSPSLRRSASSRAQSVGSGSNGMTSSVQPLSENTGRPLRLRDPGRAGLVRTCPVARDRCRPPGTACRSHLRAVRAVRAVRAGERTHEQRLGCRVGGHAADGRGLRYRLWPQPLNSPHDICQ